MLEALANRYPEKTFFLGRAFNDTSNSYKLVWFLSILSLLARSADRSFLLADILTEMTAVAWHPVCLFRLSLGRQDKLQNAILEIQQQSRLAPNAAPEAVRDFVDGSSETKARLEFFGRYVPTRFLSPWFAERLRGEKDFRRDRQVREFARDSQATPLASPYWFDADSICLNDSWRLFLVENAGVVQAFAEHHFAHYLQARNPNVPGIVNKMSAPAERGLTVAREFWRWIRGEFARAGEWQLTGNRRSHLGVPEALCPRPRTGRRSSIPCRDWPEGHRSPGARLAPSVLPVAHPAHREPPLSRRLRRGRQDD